MGAKDDRYGRELAEIQLELDRRRKTPVAAEGAFTDAPANVNEEPMPEALPPGKGMMQSAAEAIVPTIGSMVTSTAAGRAALAAPIPNPLIKGAVVGAAAVGGAFAGGYGGDMSMEGIKYSMGLPGAPDSFDEAMRHSTDAGKEQAVGELWGQGIGAVTSRLAPYRRSVTPESYELMKDQARRLRTAYEAIGGKELVEDTRKAWNPMRMLRPMETELDDSAVVKRLVEKGMDPKAARDVALSGGLTPSHVESSMFSRLQGIVTGSKVSPSVRQEARNRAKATLTQASVLEDVGLQFVDVMPAEDWGKALNGAIRGRFAVLNAARETGMKAIADDLPPLHLISMKGLKNKTAAGTGVELLHGLPDYAKFDDISKVRTNIVSMANDLHLSPEERYEAAMLAKKIDVTTRKGMPKNLKGEFDLWAQADNDLNFEQFNTAFMKGMLKKPKVARKYAEEIVRLGDSDSYKSLERALANTPDGEKLFANVKAAVGDRFLEKAKVGDIIQPSKLRLNIDTESKGYGRAFLNRTLGPDFVKHAENYATVSEQIDEAMRKAGKVAGAATTVGTMGSAAKSVMALYHGNMGAGDVIPLVGAMFSPQAVSSILASKTASKYLLKAAENVAKGRNPKTAGRLAGRALSAVGLTPEVVLKGMGVLPEERLQEQEAQIGALQGEAPMPGGVT